MSRRRFAPSALCALAAGFLAAAAAPAAVESFVSASHCGGRRFEPAQTLPLFRGTSFELAVRGFGVDNADRVEAVSLPGVAARLTGRRPFPVPLATIGLKVDADAATGKGELRLRYAVEVAGYDRIRVEVLDPPAISSFAIERKRGPGAADVVETGLGEEEILIVGGTKLLDVKPRLPFGPAGAFSGVEAVSASATELRVRLRALRPGRFTLDRESFVGRLYDCPVVPAGTAKLTLVVSPKSPGK